MTPGERAVWAAAYGASWSRLRGRSAESTEKSQILRRLSSIAREAAEEAWAAVQELRSLAEDDGEFSGDAREIIQGYPVEK